MGFDRYVLLFFFKQKTAYDMRISDWSSDVCSSDLFRDWFGRFLPDLAAGEPPSLFTPATVSDRSDGKIAHLDGFNLTRARSEERRVGKECVSTCRSRWAPYH